MYPSTTSTPSARAVDAGASAAQVHDTLVLVAGLGFHTLAEGSRRLVAVLRKRGADVSLLRLSPEAFEAFVAFVAIPWRNAALPASVKELICMALDAVPTHHYRPGLRLHLVNAVRLGIGRAAVLEALAIAAAAPPHRSVASRRVNARVDKCQHNLSTCWLTLSCSPIHPGVRPNFDGGDA